jgi:hypothetical protein
MALLLGGSGVASAVTVEPVPPTAPKADIRGRKHPFAPIEWFYRQPDMSRQNVGLQGRINATKDEQLDNLTGWTPKPLSGGNW